MSKQTLIELVKDSPVPTVAGLSAFGLTLNEWVLIFAVLLGLIRVGSAVLDLYWKWKDRRNGSK